MSGSATRAGLGGLLPFALLACGGDGGSKPVDPVEPPPEPYARPSYTLVSEARIYSDLTNRVPARQFAAFAPTFALWSDAAEKRRFIALPHGTSIDTQDMNHWRFPVGTRLAKEFWVDGTLVETRLIERYGNGQNDYFFGAFVWRPSGEDAELSVEGEEDALGTAHDVPSQKQCLSCHNGEAGRVLGFSGLQLSGSDESDGLTLSGLVAGGRLSDPPGELPGPPPGDSVTSRALGYLHANCGHCHNLHGTSWPDTQMVLRLDVEETVAEDSELFRSVVGVPVQYFRDDNAPYRVVPGDPDASALTVRMRARDADAQMPPLATELVDDEGLTAVSAWIDALPAGGPDADR